MHSQEVRHTRSSRRARREGGPKCPRDQSVGGLLEHLVQRAATSCSHANHWRQSTLAACRRKSLGWAPPRIEVRVLHGIGMAWKGCTMTRPGRREPMHERVATVVNGQTRGPSARTTGRPFFEAYSVSKPSVQAFSTVRANFRIVAPVLHGVTDPFRSRRYATSRAYASNCGTARGPGAVLRRKEPDRSAEQRCCRWRLQRREGDRWQPRAPPPCSQENDRN